MSDPVSIGAIVAAALSAGATEAGKSVLPTVVNDAYHALKSTVLRLIGSDVERLEANPDSEARKGVVAELVDEQPEPEKIELRVLVAALTQALERDGMHISHENMLNQFNNSGSGQQFNAPGGTQNFGTEVIMGRPKV